MQESESDTFRSHPRRSNTSLWTTVRTPPPLSASVGVARSTPPATQNSPGIPRPRSTTEVKNSS